MEIKSGRSSRVSDRSNASSRLSGADVNLLLERIGAAQADTRNSIEAIKADLQGNMGAIHADLQENLGAVQENLGAVQENIGAVGAAQVETREVLETVIHRLDRLEASPVPKFVAGLDLNPSLSNEMTAAPTHSPISLEVKQCNPEVSTAPVVPRRSERLVTKPKVDYRQVALLPRWPTSTAVSSNSCPGPTLYPSSSFAALQQHANPSAFETVPATLVERGRNVTLLLLLFSIFCFRQLRILSSREKAVNAKLYKTHPLYRISAYTNLKSNLPQLFSVNAYQVRNVGLLMSCACSRPPTHRLI